MIMYLVEQKVKIFPLVYFQAFLNHEISILMEKKLRNLGFYNFKHKLIFIGKTILESLFF